MAVGGKVALLPIPLGTANFLVHHIHAFMIHVTVSHSCIYDSCDGIDTPERSSFSRSSRLIPDKANLGFHFPCDGLGR